MVGWKRDGERKSITKTSILVINYDFINWGYLFKNNSASPNAHTPSPQINTYILTIHAYIYAYVRTYIHTIGNSRKPLSPVYQQHTDFTFSRSEPRRNKPLTPKRGGGKARTPKEGQSTNAQRKAKHELPKRGKPHTLQKGKYWRPERGENCKHIQRDKSKKPERGANHTRQLRGKPRTPETGENQ